jgi:uncharacterized membrane protein
MHVLVAALLIGVIAGLRTFTAPAAVSWGAHAGRIPLAGTHFAWVGHTVTVSILTALAALEILIIDQLPSTPSRKAPPSFITRMISGGLSGGAIGLAGGSFWPGLVLGLIGAVIGTLGGAAFRARLAAAFGKDRPAAILEDALDVIGAFFIIYLA